MRQDFGNRSSPSSPDLGGLCSANSSLVADRQLVAAACPAAVQHRLSVLGLHTSAESVRLGALAIIRLESTFRHCIDLLDARVAHARLRSFVFNAFQYTRL